MEASAEELRWLIGDAEPTPEVLQEARQAAVAWYSMKTWLACCWESAVTVMCAMHALRILDGKPDPWTVLDKARLAAKTAASVPTIVTSAAVMDTPQGVHTTGIDTSDGQVISTAQLLPEQRNVDTSVDETNEQNAQPGDASLSMGNILEAKRAEDSTMSELPAQQTGRTRELASHEINGVPNGSEVLVTNEGASGSITDVPNAEKGIGIAASSQNTASSGVDAEQALTSTSAPGQLPMAQGRHVQAASATATPQMHMLTGDNNSGCQHGDMTGTFKQDNASVTKTATTGLPATSAIAASHPIGHGLDDVASGKGTCADSSDAPHTQLAVNGPPQPAAGGHNIQNSIVGQGMTALDNQLPSQPASQSLSTQTLTSVNCDRAGSDGASNPASSANSAYVYGSLAGSQSFIGAPQCVGRLLVAPVTVGQASNQAYTTSNNSSHAAQLPQSQLHSGKQLSVLQTNSVPAFNTDAKPASEQATSNQQIDQPSFFEVQAIQVSKVGGQIRQDQLVFHDSTRNMHLVDVVQAAVPAHEQQGGHPAGSNAPALDGLQHIQGQTGNAFVAQQGISLPAGACTAHQVSPLSAGTSSTCILTGTSALVISEAAAGGIHEATTAAGNVGGINKAVCQALNGTQDQQLSNAGDASGGAQLTAFTTLAGSDTAASLETHDQSPHTLSHNTLHEVLNTVDKMHAGLTAPSTQPSAPISQPHPTDPAKEDSIIYNGLQHMVGNTIDITTGQGVSQSPLSQPCTPATPLDLLLQQHQASHGVGNLSDDRQYVPPGSLGSAEVAPSLNYTKRYPINASAQTAAACDNVAAGGDTMPAAAHQSAVQHTANQMILPQNGMGMGHDDQKELQASTVHRDQQAQMLQSMQQGTVLTSTPGVSAIPAWSASRTGPAMQQPSISQQGAVPSTQTSQGSLLADLNAPPPQPQQNTYNTAHTDGIQAALMPVPMQVPEQQPGYDSSIGTACKVDSLQHSNQQGSHVLLSPQPMTGNQAARHSIEHQSAQSVMMPPVLRGSSGDTTSTASAALSPLARTLPGSDTAAGITQSATDTEKENPSLGNADHTAAPSNIHVMHPTIPLMNQSLAVTPVEAICTSPALNAHSSTSTGGVAGISTFAVQQVDGARGYHYHSNAVLPGNAATNTAHQDDSPALTQALSDYQPPASSGADLQGGRLLHGANGTYQAVLTCSGPDTAISAAQLDTPNNQQPCSMVQAKSGGGTDTGLLFHDTVSSTANIVPGQFPVKQQTTEQYNPSTAATSLLQQQQQGSHGHTDRGPSNQYQQADMMATSTAELNMGNSQPTTGLKAANSEHINTMYAQLNAHGQSCASDDMMNVNAYQDVGTVDRQHQQTSDPAGTLTPCNVAAPGILPGSSQRHQGCSVDTSASVAGGVALAEMPHNVEHDIATPQSGLGLRVGSEQAQSSPVHHGQQAQLRHGSIHAEVITSMLQSNVSPPCNTVGAEAAHCVHSNTTTSVTHNDNEHKLGNTSDVHGTQTGLDSSLPSNKSNHAVSVANNAMLGQTVLPQSTANQQGSTNLLPNSHVYQGSGPVTSQEHFVMQQSMQNQDAHYDGQPFNTEDMAGNNSMSQQLFAMHGTSYQQLQGPGVQQASMSAETGPTSNTVTPTSVHAVDQATRSMGTGSAPDHDVDVHHTAGQTTAGIASSAAMIMGTPPTPPTHVNSGSGLMHEPARQGTDPATAAVQSVTASSGCAVPDSNVSTSSGRLAGHGPDSHQQPEQQRQPLAGHHNIQQEQPGHDSTSMQQEQPGSDRTVIQTSHNVVHTAGSANRVLLLSSHQQGGENMFNHPADSQTKAPLSDSKSPGPVIQLPVVRQAYGSSTSSATHGLVLYSTSKPSFDTSYRPQATNTTTESASMGDLMKETVQGTASNDSLLDNQEASCMDGTIAATSAASDIKTAHGSQFQLMQWSSQHLANRNGCKADAAAVTLQSSGSYNTEREVRDQKQFPRQQLVTAEEVQTWHITGLPGMTEAEHLKVQNKSTNDASISMQMFGGEQQQGTQRPLTQHQDVNANNAERGSSMYKSSDIQDQSRTDKCITDNSQLQQLGYEQASIPSQRPTTCQPSIHSQSNIYSFSDTAWQYSKPGVDDQQLQRASTGQPKVRSTQQQTSQQGALAGMETGSQGLHGNMRHRPYSVPIIGHNHQSAADISAFWNDFQANPCGRIGSATGSRLRDCVAVERLKDRLLDALLSLKLHQLIPSKPSDGSARSSLQSQQAQRGSMPDLAQGPVAKAIYSAIAYNNGLVPLKQFQTLLNSQGCAVTITQQDLKDLQSLDILASKAQALYLDVQRLCTDIRVDGPEYSPLASSHSPRLLKMVLGTAQFIHNKPHTQPPKYMHWMQFNTLLSHHGTILRPVDWTRLQPYLMVTTKQHQVEEDLLPHTTYVLYAKLLADINRPGAPRTTPTQSIAQVPTHDGGVRPSTSMWSLHNHQQSDDGTVAHLRNDEMSLDERIKRLVQQSHGRSVVPPSNQEWSTVLTQLERSIGKARQYPSPQGRTAVTDHIAQKEVPVERVTMQINVSLPALGVPKSKGYKKP